MNSWLNTPELGWLLFGISLLGGLQAVACGVWARMLAEDRGHPGIKWFWFGFFLSAVGVLWARQLPGLLPGGNRCEGGCVCSRLCALVNECVNHEPAQDERHEGLENTWLSNDATGNLSSGSFGTGRGGEWRNAFVSRGWKKSFPGICRCAWIRP